MSDLTTTQIAALANRGRRYPNYAWEYLIENQLYQEMMPDQPENLAVLLQCLLFLEHLFPGRRWTPWQINVLMNIMQSGRWESAEELGRQRAEEDLEDRRINGATFKKIADDEAWGDYVESRTEARRSGEHVWRATDRPGTVIYIHGLRSIDDITPRKVP